MNQKAQTFAALAESTASQLTKSYTEWTGFLGSMGRLYKYPYIEQVFIYAQRPEATACASYDVWNKRMGRVVRRGCKGIALPDAGENSRGLRYVFDIEDTVSRNGSRRPYVWEYLDEHEEPVTRILAEKYGITDEGGLAYQLEAIAQDLAGGYWEDHMEDILASIPGSFLEEFDELNVEMAFRDAASVSTAYVLFSRCGLDPDGHFSKEDFMPVFDFNTLDAVTALGTAVSENSEQVLRQIEIVAKNHERTRRIERRELYGEQPGLPAGGGLPAARIRGGNTIDFGEIRTDEGAVSAGGTPGTVQPADSQREADGTPDGDRPDGQPEVGTADAVAEEVHGPDGTDEGQRPHEVGGPDEQREIQGGGDDSGRADLQLEDASEGEIPNLFDLAGSTIPLKNEPVENAAPIRPLLPQNVIDAALTLGANAPDSRLRIIAEFMKDKPLGENARFLRIHYKENGAGFYVGERKYSLWYNEAGMQIAAGESALTLTATAVTWEQAAERIRELLDEGRYASQSMLHRAWPFEKNRVAEALQYLHRDINEEYKEKYLPTLTAALSGAFSYPGVVDKTKELLEQPEQLKSVMDEFAAFQKDYAHNRDILRFRHRPDEIMLGLQDLQCTPLKFTASPDYAPVERFYISQDEIDKLLREQPDHHDYRISIFCFFEQHPDHREREKYLRNSYGALSDYTAGNDNTAYTSKELTFTHGSITEPYAAIKMQWPQVRKRIEELIKKDAFLSPEDREIMESRTLEAPAEEPSVPISAEDAKKHDILMANTKAHFASYEEVKRAHPRDIVLFQRGDFFEMYGPDARVASVELDILLTNRNIPEFGRVAMCGVPANDLERCVEILRKEHDVTISAAPENGAERQTYYFSSYKDVPKVSLAPPSRDSLDQASEQIITATPQMVPNIDEYTRIKGQFPGYVVGVQNGDTLYFYGTDAEKSGPALNRNVLIRDIPGMGAVSITGDAESWQASKEKLLRKGIDLAFVRLDDAGKYEVITSRTAAEYIPVGMELDIDGRRCRIEGVDFQQDAVRLAILDSDLTLTESVRYVREYVEEAYDKELEKAAKEEKSRLFVEHVMEDVEQLAEQEQPPTVRELYEHYKEILRNKLMEDEAFQNACLNSDRQNAIDEGHNAVERAAKDLGIAQGDMQFYKLYYGNTPFHNRLNEELANEGYDAYMALSAELPPWGVEIRDHSPWGIVQTSQELAEGVFKVSTPSHGGIMVRETPAKEYLPAELLARGGKENGWYYFEEDALAPQVMDELTQKGLDPKRETSLPDSITPPLNQEENRPGQTRPERNYRSFTRLFPEIADGSYHYLRMESGAGIGGMMPLHVEWISDDTVSISHTYTQNGDLMHDPEMTFLIDRDKGTMEAASYQQDSLGIYQNVYPEPGRWVPELRKDLNNFAQQWFENISEQNYVKREAIVVENGEDVTLEFDSEGTLIQPKQLPDEPRNPLSPAYKVGDSVYLDDKEFAITEIGLHDVQLQDPTLFYPVFRSENKETFEKLLRRDERNIFITDYLTYAPNGPMDDGGNLRDALSSEGGLLNEQSKNEVSEWLRSGEGNAVIAQRLQEKYDGTSETMTLETGETAEFSIYGDRSMLSLLGKSHTVRMYDLWMVAGVLRDMYQRELGGFHHDLPLQEPSAVEVSPATIQPEIDAQPDIAPSASPKFSTKTVAVYPAEKNNLPFDVVIETLHIEEPQRGPKPQNFHITDVNLGAGGAKSKYQMNMAALHALQKIESENRAATPEEQDILSKYVGWGALPDAFDEGKPDWTAEYKELRKTLTPEEYESARASTLNAHYTSPTVIKAIYQTLENMGFKGGNILEPSCGVGNFFGLLPDSMSGSKLYGVELDGLTGRIAKQLYPNAHIEIKGYENTNFQNNSFDLAIGNVPFGQYKVFDPAYNKLGFSIHNYFFAKTIDQVRPGGIIAYVTSRYTMDSKSTDAREYMAQRAELLGAIRLPNNAFLSNAGTEVVSDILFLQKREQPITELPDWVKTGENKDGYTINSYFILHPEMILGEQSSDSTQYGRQDFTVKPIPGADLGEQLREAISHIDGRYVEAETVSLEEETEQETVPADPEVKNFSYTIIKGDVYYRQDSVMVKMKLGATAKARTTALIDLRDCTRQLIAEQMELSTKDEDIHSSQAELNRLYDNFAAKFGRINDKTNERAFSDDSSYYLLCALEILDDDGKFVRKADMFTKRTILPRQEITHVDTATEALEVSIGERARVDIPFMAGLTGKTEEEIISDLQGQIFRVPFREPPLYQPADEYLSGNVREKLNVAEVAAESDPAYNINVNALAAVQPKDLDASEISVRLGTDWIDPEYVEQFMYELFKTPGYAREYIHVQYSSTIHAWNISGKRLIRENDVTAYTTYGTSRVSAYKLLEDALNLQNTRVFDTKTVNGEDKRELNAKETTLAQQKQDMIKYAFQDWIWKDPDRRQKLVRKYNDEMNCIRPRQYDGSHLVLAGMNPEIQLEEHQKNAIARAIYGGNTLFAHCVGAGKTFEITASAMEMKRLGLCSKSMIVVPNHITGQWASEFLRLYPNANILVTTKRDFEKDRRKKFCSRIATGDYDAVIIGYSQFEKIPVSKERRIRQLHQQIDAIVDGIALAKAEDGKRFTVKNMERTKRSLELRLKKLQADNRKDTVIDFEELGIDRLFVDESDNFKNLFLVTKMQNVAGLSTSDAQKSTDMFNKTRYLDEITDYKGVIFATGTPISNSITEMFTVQRYLQSNALKAMNMEHFDSWASRFGETTTTMELAPEGTGYRPRTRFAKFFNLPELMNIFHEVADIKTEDMLNLPTPDVEFHNIVAKPTEFQKAYVQELSERATDVRRGNVEPTEDNLLKITNDGRKLGLDQRLISPLAEDAPDSKLNLCVDNIMRFWEEGKEDKLTQLVFSDLSTPKKDGSFNVYDDIKHKLMARGVPESEVAFIHDADTEVKKKELFAKVRSGKVRVLIGSTQKLGAGTNVQDRLIALHHLDCPWRPRDLTQREGRIIRRGNNNTLVHVFRYATEGTFDSYLWQTVEKKQQFIGQIMTSKSPARTCEDVDEAALSYAEVKALCAGDPRIKERMELDVEVAKLQVMQSSHNSQQYDLEDKVRLYFPQEQQRLEWRIEGIERDMAALAEHPLPADGYIGIDLLGQHFDERKKAGVVLLNELKNVKTYTMSKAGEYRGLEVHVRRQNLLSEPQIVLKGAVEYAFTASDSDIGNITRIDNALERLPEELAKAQASLENVKQQFESAKAEVGKPFPQEQEFKDKLARIAELDIALKMVDDPSQQPVAAVSREESAVGL